MKMLIEIIVAFISFHLQQIEVKIKILITILWLQYEQIMMEILIKVHLMLEANFQYDFTINHYLLDVNSHIMIKIIDDAS